MRFLYPAFGLLVIGLFAFVVQSAREPFEVSNERGVASRATAGSHGSGYRRHTSVWFWGFGGK